VPGASTRGARSIAHFDGSSTAHGEAVDSGTIRFPKVQPVHRPEWASPLAVGRHAREFLSALPERPTRDVLQTLRDDPKLLSFLERRELGRLELSGRVPNPSWRGSYDPPSRDVVVNAFRGPETYGKEFYPPELPTVSESGRNLVEAMQRSLYHEIGHSVLDAAGPEPGRQVRRLFRSGSVMPVSLRAKVDPVEYFCETFAAYRFEDGLADKDPNGYDMIKAILWLVFE
jgi:hypothetical protein